MIKYILPAIIIFLIVVFWEKITEIVFKKFKDKIRRITDDYPHLNEKGEYI